MSLSISRILVNTSSVLSDMISSGMSSQLSSSGWMGVVSIVASSFGADDCEGASSGFFSGFEGGGFGGGGAEDIVQ